MKRKITTKLGVSIASIAVSVILLAAVSFAWYTINTKAEAGDLTIIFKGIKWPIEAGYQEIKIVNNEVTKVTDENGNPVISWAKELNISEYLDKLGLDDCKLRPVSTYDLQHWYAPVYSAAGDVNGFEEVHLDTIANLTSAVDEDTQKDLSSGSVIYFDIWVRETNENEEAGLKLSTVEPYIENGTVKYGDKIVTTETVEGTYILTKPSVVTDKNNAYVYDSEKNAAGETILSTTDSNKDALNSIRIGFAALDSSNKITSYFIYEPNADRHSAAAHESGSNYTKEYATHYILNDIQRVDKAVGVNEYADNYTLKFTEEAEETEETEESEEAEETEETEETDPNRFNDYLSVANVLLETAPLVSYDVDADTGDKIAKYSESASFTDENQAFNGERITLKDATTSSDGTTYDLLYTYVPTLVVRNGIRCVELHPQMTVRQLGSDWDMDKVIQKDPSVTVGGLDSSCVKTFGQFIDETPVLCRVKNGESGYQKIRIFVWLEGQDIDCWNETINASIFANLEFTGVEITEFDPENTASPAPTSTPEA